MDLMLHLKFIIGTLIKCAYDLICINLAVTIF